jgi:galactokinase/mevalonate kinase-like predicted kinase
MPIVIFAQDIKKSELYEMDINELGTYWGTYYIDKKQHSSKITDNGIESIFQW